MAGFELISRAVMVLAFLLAQANAFTSTFVVSRYRFTSHPCNKISLSPRLNTFQFSKLYAANQGGKKRRRKRKDDMIPAESPTTEFDPNNLTESNDAANTQITQTSPPSPQSQEIDKPGKSETPAISFKFDRAEALALGIEDASDQDDDDGGVPSPDFKLSAAPRSSQKIQEKGAIDLPSMQDVLLRKQKTSPDKQAELQKQVPQEKIDRRDIQKFKKLLEVDPNADMDTSNFIPDEYNTVSALLGEGAKSFLGLPFAVLQVGHFILALGIVLMAFVQYPGFPLTNLPSKLRESLQQGLGIVYLINTVLAVLAIFEADKRSQPKALWAAKTFTVGGLAFDQLTQLPTKEQLAKSKGRKSGRK